MSILLLLLATLLLSAALTSALRRYALAKHLMDIPNARSSHVVPTPRGGGVAIVVTFIAAAWLYGVFTGFAGAGSWLPALLGAGGLVAAVGFLDDHGHIAARWRLLAHFAAAGWLLYWLGGLPPVPLFGIMLDMGVLGTVLAAFYLVWLLNLYNFMDGIDGIAGIEAVTVCLGAMLSCYLALEEGSLLDAAPPAIILPLLLATAVMGFLVWNYPPARIFMGDAGSGFLGLLLGGLSIQAAWQAPELFWCWLILLGVFIVDATFTLLRRLFRGERVYEAHRSHAYQYASRYYRSHKTVTLGVGAINLLWLLPLALLAASGQLDGATAVLVAYLPLVWLAVKFNAGLRECP